MGYDYGPQVIEVERLLATVDLLDDDRVELIVAAYRMHGLPHARYAHIAAYQAGRRVNSARAAQVMTEHAQMYGLTYEGDPNDIRVLAWAATNAAIAIATEDLIGLGGYSIEEYAQLIDPWFAGFEDQPIIYGGERV